MVAVTLAVAIFPLPLPSARQHPQPPGVASNHQAARREDRPDRQRRAKGHTARRAVHRAGDPGVTIADFQFSPGTTTISVGDTITWTNSGPSAHTATARDGSFDSGTLQKGASASHTFTQAGTFAYFCKIHPFMHGTVVVRASATTTSSGQTSSGSTATGSATSSSSGASAGTTAAASRTSLPATGLNVILTLCLGGALVGVGVALRRRGSGDRRVA